MSETLKVSQEHASLINRRTVDAAKANVEYGGSLCEDGNIFAVMNNLEIAVNIYLFYAVELGGMSIQDAIEELMQNGVKGAIDTFMENPDMAARAIKELDAGGFKVDKSAGDDAVIDRVNQILAEEGYEVNLVCAGDSMEEIAEQLNAQVEGEGQTRQ